MIYAMYFSNISRDIYWNYFVSYNSARGQGQNADRDTRSALHRRSLCTRGEFAQSPLFDPECGLRTTPAAPAAAHLCTASARSQSLLSAPGRVLNCN